jgi:L-histidine Nalpha-methyltransferase / hercynylcysteine S-oxide synthase
MAENATPIRPPEVYPDSGLEHWLAKPLSKAHAPAAQLTNELGNFDRDGAAAFLRGFADVLHVGDSILVGLDSCENPGKV